MSPPAGSHSASSTGRGQTAASVTAVVVTPGAPLSAATAMSTRPHPAPVPGEAGAEGVPPVPAGPAGVAGALPVPGPARAARPSPAPPPPPAPAPVAAAAPRPPLGRTAMPTMPFEALQATAPA